MSDWQAGDLALCVKMGPWSYIHSGEVILNDPVRAGMVLKVRGVSGEGFNGSCLWFEGVGGEGIEDAYASDRFRKVTPPAADEFDREVIALMNGIRVGEPA